MLKKLIHEICIAFRPFALRKPELRLLRAPALLSLSPLANIIAPLSLIFLVAACSSNGSSISDSIFGSQQKTQETAIPAADGEKIRIALILPLSAEGRSAKIAEQLKQAGELALFEADNPNIILITKDTKGTPEGARAAADAAVRDGAEIILGPLFSASVRAATPIVQQANIPMIAFSSDQTVAGNGVYLLSFLAGHDVSSIIGYAVSQGKRRFAAYLPQDAYGQIAEQALRKAVASHGAEIVAIATYPKDTNGMVTAAKPLAEAALAKGADSLFMPGGQQFLPQLSSLIPYHSIDTEKIKLLGSSRWDYASVGNQKPLIGGWFPAPDPAGWRQYSQRFTQTYGAVPKRITTLPYDAVSLAVSLSRHPKGSRFSPSRLTQTSGFAGVDGLFRLMPSGVSERRFAILEVQKFGSKVIRPAPTQFGGGFF